MVYDGATTSGDALCLRCWARETSNPAIVTVDVEPSYHPYFSLRIPISFSVKLQPGNSPKQKTPLVLFSNRFSFIYGDYYFLSEKIMNLNYTKQNLNDFS